MTDIMYAGRDSGVISALNRIGTIYVVCETDPVELYEFARPDVVVLDSRYANCLDVAARLNERRKALGHRSKMFLVDPIDVDWHGYGFDGVFGNGQAELDHMSTFLSPRGVS